MRDVTRDVRPLRRCVDVLAALDCCPVDELPKVRRDAFGIGEVVATPEASLDDGAVDALQRATSLLRDRRANSTDESRERFFAVAVGNLVDDAPKTETDRDALETLCRVLDDEAFNVSADESSGASFLQGHTSRASSVLQLSSV